jgi:hypothetical protein
MAYTLAQLAKVETDRMRKGVIMNILRNAKVMEGLPFENVDSLTSQALRLRTLGTGAAFRKIGGSYTEYTDADVEAVWESVYGFGGEIKFDKVFGLIKNTIVDPKVFQTQMKLKAMALQWNDYFINGDHATDADGFVGLKVRVAGMPSRQSIAIGDSDSLDVTASIANARLFIDKWEQAWHYCNGGQVNAMFMNEGTYLGFPRALRYVQASGGNFLDVTKDSFDREIVTYKGAPMIDMGVKVDQSTEIITSTETALDSGADGTSVYFASYGIEEGITGIQLNNLEAYDPNNGQELATAPATMLRVDWWNGLAGFGSYGLVRLSNLKAASSWT